MKLSSHNSSFTSHYLIFKSNQPTLHYPRNAAHGISIIIPNTYLYFKAIKRQTGLCSSSRLPFKSYCHQITLVRERDSFSPWDPNVLLLNLECADISARREVHLHALKAAGLLLELSEMQHHCLFSPLVHFISPSDVFLSLILMAASFSLYKSCFVWQKEGPFNVFHFPLVCYIGLYACRNTSIGICMFSSAT